MGLLLNPEDLPSKAVKGGQEHDLWHEETTDRYWKLINMPFDVIPCLPEGGFLNFIRDTLAAGHSLRAVRTTRSHTTP